MELDKKLHDEIKGYCKLNGLKMNDFINHLVKKAFNIEKYGLSPFSPKVETFIPEKEEDKKVETISTIEENKKTDNISTDEIKTEEVRKRKRKLK